VHRISIGFFSLVAVGGFVACSDSEPFDDYVAKVRSCGLLSDGTLPGPIEAPEVDCFYGCLAGGSCDEITSVFCADGDSALEIQCLDRCAFTCDSGDPIDLLEQCDGYVDCADGSDELGCGHWLFGCGDGEQIPRSSVCDGEVDCDGGRDEDGCHVFDCGGGAVIIDAWVCDGEDDCDNGADEAGCADRICG
jgi:hypothetical protein